MESGILRSASVMRDCIVIGAGLVGLLTARELRRHGLDVLVLERGRAGQEASWAGGGILSPLHPWRCPEPLTALQLWSQGAHPRLARELYEETGIDPEWQASGLLVLEPDELEPAQDWARRFDVRLQPLSPPQIRALEPALSPFDTAGLWLPEVAQVRNPRLVQAVRASVMASGAELREGAAVSGLVVGGRGIEGVRVDGQLVRARRVVVAAGAWSGELLDGLGSLAPMRPVLGQMLMFLAPPALLGHILLRYGHYLIPRRDGRILAGSTVEDVGFDKRVSAAARGELLAAATALVPALADCRLERHWAGLRPGIGRETPLIGEHPAVRGLFVNAGHYRNGVCLAPASARLLADLMTGSTPIVDPDPFAPRLIDPRRPPRGEARAATRHPY